MDKNLVWMDLEFSGLEPETDVILEIATIITDENLEVIAEGPNLAIYQSETILSNLDDWNQKHHTQTGLLDRVRASSESHESAETKTLEFIKKYCNERKSPLCGNSIHQDRRYLYKYMPILSEYLHYRNIDVSSFKEIAQRWYPSLPSYKKSGGHRALADIKESIEEMKYFRSSILKAPQDVTQK